MKMQFTLVVKGEDTFRKKFHEILQTKPDVQMELIKFFGHGIMLAFGLNESDNIIIESFRAGEIGIEVPPNADLEKDVDKKVAE